MSEEVLLGYVKVDFLYMFLVMNEYGQTRYTHFTHKVKFGMRGDGICRILTRSRIGLSDVSFSAIYNGEQVPLTYSIRTAEEIKRLVTFASFPVSDVHLSKPDDMSEELYQACLKYYMTRVHPDAAEKLLAHLMDTKQFEAADACVERFF